MPITILIIDDEPRVLQAFSRNVRLAGYRVITAGNGTEGLKLYHQELPEIVMTDLRMPDMSGQQVLEAIRAHDPEANVILVSGHGDDQAILDALRAGTSDFLAKPVDQIALESALCRAAEKVHLKRELRASQAALRQQNAQLEETVRERTAELERELAERKQAEAARQKAERDLKLVFDTVPALIWQKDSAGVYVQVNRAYCETVGIAATEIIGKTDAELFPPEIAAKYQADDRLVLQSGETCTGIEEYHRKPSGDYGWSRTDKTLYYDAAGQIAGTIGFALDITERKQMEIALRESEEHFRWLADDLPSLICEYLPDSTLLFVNKAYCEYFGMTKEDLRGVRFFDFLPEHERESVRTRLASMTSENPTLSYMHAVTHNSTVRWHEWHDRAIFDSNGVLLYYIGIGHDITDRKQAEAALRESEERFRSYVKHAPYGIFIADEQGRYVEVNPAACAITGYTAEELLRMRISDLTPPQAQETARAHFQQVVETGQAIGKALPFLHQSGEVRYWTVDAARLSPTRLMGYVQDVTERKQMEEALRESEERFAKAFYVSPAPMVICALEDGKMMNVNESYLVMTGYTQEELRGHSARALGIWNGDAHKLAQLRENGSYPFTEIQIHSRSGETRAVLARRGNHHAQPAAFHPGLAPRHHRAEADGRSLTCARGDAGKRRETGPTGQLDLGYFQ